MAQLNQRQTLFVAAYLQHGNATQAATDAGYSARSASSTGERMLRNDEVANAIRAAQDRVADAAEVEAADITRGLLEIARHGDNEVARVRAYELVGKHIGYFPKEKSEQEHTGGIEVRFAFDPRPPQ